MVHCVFPLMDSYNLGVAGCLVGVIQLGCFLVAAGFKTDALTDVAFGANFVAIAAVTFALGGAYYVRQYLVTIAVVLWGVRLATFLALRVQRSGRDPRFDSWERGFTPLFFGFWVLQAAWVFIVSSPVFLLNAMCSEDPPLNWMDYLGWGLFVVGFLIEVLADHQKFEFRCSPRNDMKWCDVGLWSWTRHPNYFGEIMLWWGIWLACSSVLHGWMWWLAIISPAWVTLFIVLGSGVRTLENAQEQKYWDNDQYRAYVKRTSCLIPFHPDFFEPIPAAIKAVFFFEWPCLWAVENTSKVV